MSEIPKTTNPTEEQLDEPCRLETIEQFTDVQKILSLIGAIKESLDQSHGEDFGGFDFEFKQLVDTIDNQNNGLSIEDIDALLKATINLDDYREDTFGTKTTEEQGLTTVVFLNRIPDETLKHLYQTEIGGERSILSNFLNSNALTSSHNKSFNVWILARIYSLSGGLDKVAEGDDSAVDRLRPFFSDAVMGLVSLPGSPEELDRKSVRIYNKEVFTRMIEIFDKMGLSEEVTIDYFRAAESRLSRSDGEHYYADTKAIALRGFLINDNVEAVGAGVIERLHEKLGVVNIDRYKSGDLESLNKLLDASPEFIEHLQAGDVTVIFADTYGDYNGAMNDVIEQYRKSSGRTLMFEVESSGDFYRRMILLKRLGMKPSTLVVAAHGLPGRIHFGDKFSLLASDRTPRETGSAIDEIILDQARLDRLINEFMQPNRGIDSLDELKGRVQIVLNSCSSDVEFEQGLPTVATAVAQRIGRADTDVYGARKEMWVSRVDEGDNVQFRHAADSESVASKVSLTSQLHVERQAVNSIPVSREEHS